MENAKPNISPRRGMTPLERAWAAALCASGDAVANMGTDALRLMATKKLQDVTSAGIMESTHKLARACRIIDVSTASTPAAQKAADAYALEAALYAVAKRGRRRQDWANTLEAAVACGCMMDAVLSYPPQWEDTNQWKQEN